MKKFCPKCDSHLFVSLPQNPKLHLCRTCTAQFLLEHGEWKRDYYAEAQYEKIASQLNLPLEQLVESEYNFAASKQNEVVVK